MDNASVKKMIEKLYVLTFDEYEKEILIMILGNALNSPLLNSYVSHYHALGNPCLRFHNTVRSNMTVLKRRFLFNRCIIIYATFLHLRTAYIRCARDAWQQRQLPGIFAISAPPF